MASSHAEIADIATRASRRTRIDIWPGLFFAAVLAASAIILALLAIVIWLSFRRHLGADDVEHYSFAHYPAIFLDPFTYRVLLNTLGFAADHARRRARSSACRSPGWSSAPIFRASRCSSP